MNSMCRRTYTSGEQKQRPIDVRNRTRHLTKHSKVKELKSDITSYRAPGEMITADNHDANVN